MTERGSRQRASEREKPFLVADGLFHHTSMTIAVSPSSISAFASRISLRQHVGLLRNVHRDLADTVSSLFSDKSRTCIHRVCVVVVVVLLEAVVFAVMLCTASSNQSGR